MLVPRPITPKHHDPFEIPFSRILLYKFPDYHPLTMVQGTLSPTHMIVMGDSWKVSLPAQYYRGVVLRNSLKLEIKMM